jgi:hypothetical protein
MLKHPHTISLKRFKPVGAQPPIEEVPVQSDDQKPRSTPCANRCTIMIIGYIICVSTIVVGLSLYFLKLPWNHNEDTTGVFPV